MEKIINNTSRLSRRNRTDIEFVEYGGLGDLFDNEFKATFIMNDDEADFISENSTEEELEIILSESPSFTTKRQMIIILNKYFEKYKSIKEKI